MSNLDAKTRPTSFRLTESQSRRADRLARELAIVGRITKADVLRGAIDRGLDALERERVRVPSASVPPPRAA